MGGENTLSLAASFQGALDSLKGAAAIQCQKIIPTGTFSRFVALLNGALDNNNNHPVFEPILKKNGTVLAYESLSRPKDNDGVCHGIQDLAITSYQLGKHLELDTLTCISGMENAFNQKRLPVSLNISVASALRPDFFEEIDRHVRTLGLKPDDIIFEILEHDVDPETDIDHLWEIKDMDYRFALDDFGIGKEHVNRLRVFGELVDFIKIDGPYICGYLKQNGFNITNDEKCKDGIFDCLAVLNKHYGSYDTMPFLIAERAHTFEEIIALSDLGFSGFQGQELKNVLAIRGSCQPFPHM